MSDQRLYVRVRGRVIGPFSLAQLKALRERGQFHRFHEVSEDRQRWVSAATLEELFAVGAETFLPQDAAPAPRRAAEAERAAEAIIVEATEWYYVDGQGNQAGPVSEERLLAFVRGGTVTGSTLVWKEGMANWTALADTGLLARLQPPAGSGAAAGGRPVRAPDGVVALKGFVTDPVGGLAPLCEALGNTGALALGLVFCVIFDLCLVIGGLVADRGGHGFLGLALAGDPAEPTTAAKIALLWKLAVVAVLPLASLAGGITAIRVITGSRGCFGYDMLIAGAALLPVGLLWPFAALIGDRNWKIFIFLLSFSGCLVILILNSGFTRILGLSDRGAILAIPATLLLSSWLSIEVMDLIFH